MLEFSFLPLVFHSYYLLVILIFSFLSYSYYQLVFKKPHGLLLFFFRISSLLILLLLLLNPKIVFSKKVKNLNSINIYVDNSQSINEHLTTYNINIDSLFYKINEWSQSNQINVNYFSFSDSVNSITNPINIRYDTAITNYSELFNNINESTFKDNIIIISDGAKNYGYDKFDFNTNNVVYTIGIGENKKLYDVSIFDVELINDKDDSLTFMMQFNSKGILEETFKNIYISNYKNTLSNIGSVVFTDNNYKSKSFTINKNILAENNNFIIGHDNKEINLLNNNYLMNLQNKLADNKRVLFISGRLSPNTKHIKESIIDNVSNISVNHFYKIKDTWSSSFDNLILSDYSLIIYDNYIPDLQQYENFKNQIYFFDDFDLSENNFLKYFNCFVNDSDLVYQIDKIDYNAFVIPPLINQPALVCENTTSYYNDHKTFISDSEKGSIIYSNDLFKLENVSRIYKKNNSPTSYLIEFIENKIHNRYKGIDVYTLSNSYISNENIDIYMNINSDILIDNLYVEIIDENNNIIKIDDHIMIDEQLLKFSEKIINHGFYTILGYLNDNNKIKESNKIHISINNDNIEKNNIYIDEEFLNTIAITNNGIYSKYHDVNDILKKIDKTETYSVEKNTKNILSYQLVIILLIFLFIVEWYVRNKIGLI